MAPGTGSPALVHHLSAHRGGRLQGRDFVTGFATGFAGSFAHDFAGSLVRYFTRYFARDFASYFARDFATYFTGDFAHYFASDFAPYFTSDFASVVVGDFASDFARYFASYFKVADIDYSPVIPPPINESLTPDVRASRKLTTIDDRWDAKPLLVKALTRLVGDGWIALAASAEAPVDERRAYFHRRVLNAWLLQVWPGVDRHLEEQPDPDRLALYLALGWTQATTTRQWPATERWIALLAGTPPDDWLPRSQWHLCWLLHDPEDAGHRRALDEALCEGLGDEGRPGLAAELQKLFPRSEEGSREEIPGIEA